MSSLQSLKEFISERLAAAAEEIFRHCEGTIVQYEQELCRQRRLLDICWKPQLQLHQKVLPQHSASEEEDLCNQQRNLKVEQKEPEPSQIKEELEQPEPLQIKEEQEGFCISQNRDQLDLKHENDTLMEIPTDEENGNSEADLNNQWSFNTTDCQDEEERQPKESTSSTVEVTDPKNSEQKKRRDKGLVQSVASSNMSGSQCDSDVRNNFKNESLVKKCQQSPIENRFSFLKSGESPKIVSNLFVYKKNESDDRLYICTESGESFGYWSKFRTNTGEKGLTCKECDKSFNYVSDLKRHMRMHTGEKPFSCKRCDAKFSQLCSLKRHTRTHTGEKPFSCKYCGRNFGDASHLRVHTRLHTGEKPFLCKICNAGFCDASSLKRHIGTHTGEKPFSCTECNISFTRVSHLKRHIRTHTGERPFSCLECNKSYTRVNDLKKHMRNHTGETTIIIKD
ncbi:zinc finger protein 391 [Oryzias melastigma]|uniref:zinc finger protein 391 n=1 Tax=Oryzias melastigma TaxID=30732 RepID=UPI000CF7E394|nr:zinc finger protein 391 [Oryzias melastigma]